MDLYPVSRHSCISKKEVTCCFLMFIFSMVNVHSFKFQMKLYYNSIIAVINSGSVSGRVRDSVSFQVVYIKKE